MQQEWQALPAVWSVLCDGLMACDEWPTQIYLSWLALARVIVVDFTDIFQEGHISAYLFYVHHRRSGPLLLVIIQKEAQNPFIVIEDALSGSFSSFGFFRANKTPLFESGGHILVNYPQA